MRTSCGILHTLHLPPKAMNKYGIKDTAEIKSYFQAINQDGRWKKYKSGNPPYPPEHLLEDNDGEKDEAAHR